MGMDVRELIYEPQELARIIISCNLEDKRRDHILDSIWKYESKYLKPEYRNDRERLHQDVKLICEQLQDQKSKPVLNADFPRMQENIRKKKAESDDAVLDPNIRLYLISVRLRILFIQRQSLVRVNLKNLLAEYGYKRRTAELGEFMQSTMIALELRAGSQNSYRCDLGTTDLKEIIEFQLDRREPDLSSDFERMQLKLHEGNLFFRQSRTTYDIELDIEKLNSFEDFERFYSEQYEDELIEGNALLASYLYHLLKKYGSNPSHIAERIGRTSGYMRKLASGMEDHPERDVMLAVCVYLKATVEETQILLRYSGNRPLYAREKRDAIIWFALKKHQDWHVLNDYLIEHGYESLYRTIERRTK